MNKCHAEEIATNCEVSSTSCVKFSLKDELHKWVKNVDQLRCRGEKDEFIYQEITNGLGLNLQKARAVIDEVGELLKYQQSSEYSAEVVQMNEVRSTITIPSYSEELAKVLNGHGCNTVYLQSAIDSLSAMVEQKKLELAQLESCLQITKFTLESVIPRSNSLEMILFVAHQVEKNYRADIIGEMKGHRISVSMGSS